MGRGLISVGSWRTTSTKSMSALQRNIRARGRNFPPPHAPRQPVGRARREREVRGAHAHARRAPRRPEIPREYRGYPAEYNADLANMPVDARLLRRMERARRMGQQPAREAQHIRGGGLFEEWQLNVPQPIRELFYIIQRRTRVMPANTSVMVLVRGVRAQEPNVYFGTEVLPGRRLTEQVLRDALTQAFDNVNPERESGQACAAADIDLVGRNLEGVLRGGIIRVDYLPPMAGGCSRLNAIEKNIGVYHVYSPQSQKNNCFFVIINLRAVSRSVVVNTVAEGSRSATAAKFSR